jgi:hypothetical protein
LPDPVDGEMIPAVSSLRYATLAVIACLAGCNGERATSSPPESPSGAELEREEEVTEEAEGEEAPAEEEASEAEEPEAPEAPAEEPPPKKTCAELPESTCKVTVGCTWHSQNKCIDE